MVWRAYYTLEDAADALSREFNDTYTPADLVHYGALGLADFCISISTMHFFKRSLAESYYSPKFNKPLIIKKVLHSGQFAPIPQFLMREIEVEGNAKIGVFPYLLDLKGEKILSELVRFEKFLIDSDFENFDLRVSIPSSDIQTKKSRYEFTSVNCHDPQDVINTVRFYQQSSNYLPDIHDFEKDGWFYQFIPESSWHDFLIGLYPDREFLEGMDWSIEINIDVLRIMQNDFETLKNLLREKITEKKQNKLMTGNRYSTLY